MINKEELTKHIKNLEDRQLVMRSLNKVENVIKNYVPRSTDFYDPYQINLCKSVFNNVSEVKYYIEGGHVNAERQVLIVYPDYMEIDEVDNPIGALRIDGKFNKEDLTHRDFLGAILGLGLKREKIGDILLGDGQADVIAFREICEYIQINLDKVSKFNVNVEPIGFDQLSKVQEDFKLIHTTVSSLRLDAILGVGFGESRSAISKLINKDRVKVNWKVINQGSHTVAEGDVISFKGKGRIIIEEVGDKTKKDRYKVVIKRLI